MSWVQILALIDIQLWEPIKLTNPHLVIHLGKNQVQCTLSPKLKFDTSSLCLSDCQPFCCKHPIRWTKYDINESEGRGFESQWLEMIFLGKSVVRLG